VGCPSNVTAKWEHHLVEYPPTNVSVGVFWFGKIPVTVEHYCEFLNAKGFESRYANKGKLFERIERKASRYVPKTRMTKHAIGNVTFAGAVAYCEWLSSVSGFKCRLPASAEWEFVAKGKENRVYPWGNTPTEDYPFYAVPGTRKDLATQEGVFDLIGPVYQWCTDDGPPTSDGQQRKIVRGGTIFRTGLFPEKLNVPPNWMWRVSEPHKADSNKGFRVLIDP